jgi:hypothetical protein
MSSEAGTWNRRRRPRRKVHHRIQRSRCWSRSRHGSMNWTHRMDMSSEAGTWNRRRRPRRKVHHRPERIRGGGNRSCRNPSMSRHPTRAGHHSMSRHPNRTRHPSRAGHHSISRHSNRTRHRSIPGHHTGHHTLSRHGLRGGLCRALGGAGCDTSEGVFVMCERGRGRRRSSSCGGRGWSEHVVVHSWHGRGGGRREGLWHGGRLGVQVPETPRELGASSDRLKVGLGGTTRK